MRARVEERVRERWRHRQSDPNQIKVLTYQRLTRYWPSGPRGVVWRKLWLGRSLQHQPHRPTIIFDLFLTSRVTCQRSTRRSRPANRQDECPQGEVSRPHEGIHFKSATTQAWLRNPRANAHQARCNVFATVYNPDGQRLGNKVLRQRLRGPALASYYPRRRVTVKDLQRGFGPNFETWDDDEQDRLEHLEEYVDQPTFVPG